MCQREFYFLLFGIMCWDFLGFLTPLVASSKLATINVGWKKLLLVIFVILLSQIFRRLTIKAIFIKEESYDKLQLEARKISLSYLMNRFYSSDFLFLCDILSGLGLRTKHSSFFYRSIKIF